jgi:hypothetical protein
MEPPWIPVLDSVLAGEQQAAEAMARSREILFEVVRLGDTVKVSAIDPVTALEASVIGPANYPFELLKRTAQRKLERMILTARGG